ncbi:MAG: 16S rRNA (cytosine(967)-C(5))-methyltransferase RsmB [Lachnospiraceae bacterium]
MIKINTREIILEILLQIEKEETYSHIAIGNALDKYQYLPKQDRAFITRVCEGTLEYGILLDYVIDQFSTVPTSQMKPVIRQILRSGVYQLMYMDSVPNSAVCNEAVKLAQKKGFYSLKGFVNGVLRNVARKKDSIVYPSEENPVQYLSVRYSMPQWIILNWLEEMGMEATRTMLEAFLEKRSTTVRIQTTGNSVEETIKSLQDQGVTVEKAPYVPEAYYISDYNYLGALQAFQEGKIFPQDVSSMLAAHAAEPKEGNFVLDLCAAPGGKSLHMADRMNGKGTVEARDISDYKVGLLQENIKRSGLSNIRAVKMDATCYDPEMEGRADIVLADVPCSGFGVMGHKNDIKYKMTPRKQMELIPLQREILKQAARYVKPGGTLIYSTCTVGWDENQANLRWFTENFPFETESIDPYLCPELQCETTKRGYIQLIPGIHACDGFFIARLKKVEVS